MIGFITSNAILWPIVVPLTGAMLAMLFWSSPVAQRIVTAVALAAMLAAALILLDRILSDGQVAMTFGGWAPPFGISFVADRLGTAMVVVTAVLAAAEDGELGDPVLVVAPTSVVSYLAFLLRAAGPGRTTVARMPRALSYVKTRRLVIESQTPLAYRVDGHKRSASRIETLVSPRALRVNVGPRFAEMNSAEDAAKDTVRLRNLPENEARLAMIRKRLPVFTHALEDDFKDLFRLLKDSARVSTDYVTLMVLSTFVASFGLLLNSAAVIIGAMVLGNFLNIAGLPSMLRDLISTLDLSPFWVMVTICIIYVLLGMVLESMSMILLTIPILFPIVVGLGFDPVWFGILIVMVVELALITPPIGLNVYMMRSVLPDVPLRTIFAGVFLFLVPDLAKLVLIVLFPGIVLWLPSMM